jgi:hypothetical protein
MKVLPIAAIPHKSKAFRLILYLSFSLRLWDGTKLPAVNNATTKKFIIVCECNLRNRLDNIS